MVGDDGFIAEAPEKVLVPVMPREEMVKLLTRIRPVVYLNGEGACYIYPADRPVDPEVVFLRDHRKDSKADDIQFLAEIRTKHSFCWQFIFSPTMAEVLAQIPDHLIKKVVAIQIVNNPVKDEEDGIVLDQEALDALKAKHHTATTWLFERKEKSS